MEATPEAIEAEVDVALRVAAKLADKRESEKTKQSDSAFEARLTGDFTGWTGKTIFKLDNGQVWRQLSRHIQKELDGWLGDDWAHHFTLTAILSATQ